MSERSIYCPKCGTERENNSGIFCARCGARLVDVGNNPGAFGKRTEGSNEENIKNNTMANMISVGYSTWWQTYGLERKIVTAGIWGGVVLCIAGIGIGASGRERFGYLLCGIGLLMIVITAIVSAIKNRRQIKENGIEYKGHIKYVRNPITGEYVDSSTVDIHYKQKKEQTAISEKKE